MDDKMASVHKRIDETSDTFNTNLKDTEADITRKMGVAESEALRRHEKVWDRRDGFESRPTPRQN